MSVPSVFSKFSAIAFGLSLAAGIGDAHAEVQSSSDTLWERAEIVTNDPVAAQLAREATDPFQGRRISMSDPSLPAACASIRSKLPQYEVTCHPVVWQGNSAIYVVSIVTEPRQGTYAAPECASDLRLAQDLVDHAAQHFRTLDDLFRDGGDVHSEYVDASGRLDTRGVDGQRLSAETSAVVRGRFADLKRGARSCQAQDRADSVFLMNYAGLPKQAMDTALDLLTDPDVSVRNISSRFVGSFIEFLPVEQHGPVLRHACEKILEENFFERNKGMALIDSILRRSPGLMDTLEPACRSQIDSFARNSSSRQIGGFARAVEARHSSTSAGRPE